MNFYKVMFQGHTGQENILIVAPNKKITENWCKSECSCYGCINYTIEECKPSIYYNDGFPSKIRIVNNCPDY